MDSRTLAILLLNICVSLCAWKVAVGFACYLTVSVFCILLSASRAKLSMLNTMSKIRGQVKSTGYPQAEGVLGECMVRYGREMGEDTNFGTCV